MTGLIFQANGWTVRKGIGWTNWVTVDQTNWGTGFTNLHTFNTEGPHGDPLVVSGNNLYGDYAGNLFSIALPIVQLQLSIVPAGANVILSWPTNASGFTLQSTANLSASAIWATNLPAPVVVNGLKTITNPISGTQQFFRLAQ